ncbi:MULTISPECIES: ABC transporter ATP-binding protein [Providencia]|uniref:ABC transporter ATP-binding protein n=1 Tax=Providencia TaxID=586 RepID=UPI000837B501|nr:ABC transporter ATP-binding protein [Providencia heimbachae]MBP6122084.1 ABC transporter ATP-binding protein [Providencia sp.]NIH21723.1 ABC transporter ATP-binding protein [Providencia heimbachae]
MTYALELSQLTKTYPGGVKALRGIDLSVEDGDFYALLGPNGAGKSTTIGIISSLVNKTSGSVKVFGYDLEKQVVLAKQQLGLVPQEFNFNPFETVIQIVLNQAGYYGVPRDVATQRAQQYLTQLDLWEKRDERARNLSGGMKRRLMIARALMHQPKLLILDEPTAGVDIELRRSMWTFLKKLNAQGTTIILTTHYLEEAEMLCRNIGIIQHGELVENTSMKQLLSQLESETFIFDLTSKSPIPKLAGYESRLIDTSTLEVDVKREQGLNSVFSQLSEQGIQILSMRNKANRLEELFVSLVKKESNPTQKEEIQ